MAGANILKGNWKMSILIYAITFFIVWIFIFIVNKYSNNKKLIYINKTLTK